jgi:hypothetical protein
MLTSRPKAPRTGTVIAGKTQCGAVAFPAAGIRGFHRTPRSQNGIQTASAVDALELVFAAILERDVRAGHKVVRRRADENLSGVCETHDACAEVQRDPARLVAGGSLHLACVDAGT